MNDPVSIAREALRNISDDQDRGELLDRLGNRLGERFWVSANRDDLEEAVQLRREAVRITPPDHEGRTRRLLNLSLQLGALFHATGEGLEEAIDIAQNALSGAPENYANKAGLLNGLGTRLEDRFRLTGGMEGLLKAIQLGQEALALTLEDPVLRSRRLNGLVIQLGFLYLREKAPNDLEKAIQYGREAVELSKNDVSVQAPCMNSLAARLGDLYRLKGDIGHVKEAIALVQEALRLWGHSHTDRPVWLSNLGLWLQDLYHAEKKPEYLEQAIQYGEEAIESTPEDDPGRVRRLTHLASVHGIRYSNTQQVADLKACMSHYRSALRQLNSPIDWRVNTARQLSQYHMIAPDWPKAYEDLCITMDLIPRLSPRSLRNPDKQFQLSHAAGLACDATAAAFHVGKEPHSALHFLERGRGLLATSLDEVRADVQELRSVHPDLADELVQLQEAVTDSGSGDTVLELAEESTPGMRTTKRYAASMGLDKLFINIREQPGFERFLLPPSEDEYRAAATYGPIVVINVSEYRCDAILVERDQIRSLDLRSSLNYQEVKRKAQHGNLRSPEVLGWLWYAVAKPVLDSLGFTQPPSSESWPHVWWIPTGPLSKFPLHAAGRHGQGAAENVIDRVMSSYSSSIKAIVNGRKRQSTRARPQDLSQVILVEMQDTPRQNQLRFPKREISMLRDLCDASSFRAVLLEQRKEDVMSQIRDCTIFHFAGHGYTDDYDPSKSALLLKDWEKDPFTVADLLGMNLRRREPPPFLAYLSACGTGEIRNERFFDESLHLISAYQLAGFRHVIGTLWEVNDESCVDMAKITYEEVMNERMTDESVCLGLHKASRKLRERFMKHPRFADIRDATPDVSTHLENLHISSTGTDQGTALDTGELRNPVPVDNSAQCWHWVPYVHFGV